MIKQSFSKHSERGVGHLVLLLAVVVIAAVAFVGYRVINKQGKDNTALSSQQQASSAAAKTPEVITNAQDLNKINSVVSNSSVEKDLDPSQLDSDVSSLL